MIGYYVHHVGRGHLHRATAVAAASEIPVTGLSSLHRPDGWRGEWIVLPRDDEGRPVDVAAGGRLHWAPLGDDGLRARMAALSSWIDRARPGVLVSDVSVEVALLARLHGVAVVSVVLPGRRDDPAHLLGYAASAALVAAWPAGAGSMLSGLPADIAARVEPVGAISRFPPRLSRPPVQRSGGSRRVAVLLGQGGGAPSREMLERARESTPNWAWTVLGGDGGEWFDDPTTVLHESDVVVCQAGQNAIADVAAARRPAVVVAAPRPHDEQRHTARTLSAGGWPALVEDGFPPTGWAPRLARAVALDGDRWATWCDGRAAARFTAILGRVHGDRRVAA